MVLKFENSLACIDYWPTNPTHPIIKPILECIEDYNKDFCYITGTSAEPQDFENASICLLDFEKYLRKKLGKNFFTKNRSLIRKFINSRSWKSLPFELSFPEHTIYFHHSIPLRIPSKWNVFQFEDILSLYNPFFYAGITKEELIKREEEFNLVTKILRAYFEHPSIISIITHYEGAKNDFINIIGGSGVDKLRVIAPYFDYCKSVLETRVIQNNSLSENNNHIRVLFTGSHHGNPGNLLARGIQYSFKFAADLSKILINENINSTVELLVVAPSITRIEDYIGSDGVEDFKDEIKRVSYIDYGDENPNPKLKINYIVDRLTDQEMRSIKEKCDIYPDFAETLHSSSIFEAFSSNLLYCGLRKKMLEDLLKPIDRIDSRLFFSNSIKDHCKKIPSTIVLGVKEEEALFGKNLSRITNLANVVYETIADRKVFNTILDEQLLILKENARTSSIKWNEHIDNISKDSNYALPFMKMQKNKIQLYSLDRIAKLQTLFYRNMHDISSSISPQIRNTLKAFSHNTKVILDYTTYPDNVFGPNTYKAKRFDMLLTANVQTDLKESNAQKNDFYYIVTNLLSKYGSITIENSKLINSFYTIPKTKRTPLLSQIKKIFKFLEYLKRLLIFSIKLMSILLKSTLIRIKFLFYFFTSKT